MPRPHGIWQGFWFGHSRKATSISLDYPDPQRRCKDKVPAIYSAETAPGRAGKHPVPTRSTRPETSVPPHAVGPLQSIVPSSTKRRENRTHQIDAHHDGILSNATNHTPDCRFTAFPSIDLKAGGRCFLTRGPLHRGWVSRGPGHLIVVTSRTESRLSFQNMGNSFPSHPTGNASATGRFQVV